MRLIDADIFIEYLGLDSENAREENIGENVTLEDFDRQPTTYDVERLEKILEKMYEECKNEGELEEKYNEIRSMSAVCLERRAEEIGLNPDTVGY